MKKIIRKIDWSFIRFGITGVFNTLNYAITFNILLLFLPLIIAHSLAFMWSALISYFLTCFFTFKTKPTWKNFILFPLTILPNYLISTIGTEVFVTYLNTNEKYTSTILMILIIPVTFLINKIIFKKDKKLP